MRESAQWVMMMIILVTIMNFFQNYDDYLDAFHDHDFVHYDDERRDVVILF